MRAREFRDADGEVVSPVFSRATAERLWNMLKGSAEYQFNKCLTGDTVLSTGGTGTWTIGDLYARIESCQAGPSPDGLCRFDGRRARPRSGRCKVCDSWWHKFTHPDRGLTILAYDFADNRIRPKRVKMVHFNGVRPVFRIELSDGRSVKATDNHRFLTPSGWRHVFDMSVGDTMLTHGDYAHNGRRRRWQKGHAVTETKIISITAAGSEAVYDVEMDDVNHSFIANGIVSHNSHSFAYAKVTFLTAYAKANWPAQTAAAVLACTDDDEKRRRVLLDLAADGIRVAPPDINEGRATTSVGSDGRLRLGLAEIRDVGKAAGLLIAERDTNGRFISLHDLTSRMSGTGCSVKVFEALVESGALDSFGPRLGLMMAVRADRELAIDAEWGGLERSERQRMRLGVRVGEHPLAPHREALRSWRSDDGRHRSPGRCSAGPRSASPGCSGPAWVGQPGYGQPGPRAAADVLVAGVLTRWEQSTGNNGESARFDLEGSDGSWVEGVMWTGHWPGCTATAVSRPWARWSPSTARPPGAPSRSVSAPTGRR